MRINLAILLWWCQYTATAQIKKKRINNSKQYSEIESGKYKNMAFNDV